MLQRHRGEIGIELVGEDHGDGGIDTLAHLHLRHHQRGLAGMIDTDEGVGRELAGRIVGRLLRLVRGLHRQAECEHEAAGQSARHQRAARRQRTEIRKRVVRMLLCGFTTASYAWPSAARLIASRMRT